MKTTLDLPDDLVRAVKIRAVEEKRRLEDTMARRRLNRPLVECAHEARPDEEITPERVAEVLIEEEAGVRRDPLR